MNPGSLPDPPALRPWAASNASAVRGPRGAPLVLALLTTGLACEREQPSPEPPGAEASVPSPFVPAGPLEEDVWLADLSRGPDGAPQIGEPSNLTARPGYDNQPAFVPDGSGLWYTAIDVHDGQADIWRYDFEDASVTRVTMSNPESEYSPTPLPDGSGISVVRVEADSAQRLWRMDPDGSDGRVVLEDVAPVGYHAWSDERTVVLFVLGSPPRLVVADAVTGSIRMVAQDIGRSIQSIPGGSDVSFVQRRADGASTIMRLTPSSGTVEPVVDAVDGGDFHAWTPDGVLLMADESSVYAHDPAGAPDWRHVADFAGLGLEITRLAVRPDGAQIALVAEVGG